MSQPQTSEGPSTPSPFDVVKAFAVFGVAFTVAKASGATWVRSALLALLVTVIAGIVQRAMHRNRLSKGDAAAIVIVALFSIPVLTVSIHPSANTRKPPRRRNTRQPAPG